ncbi:hypothetical protein [Streptomyces sp. ZSW22]|uniref:hypothetical protein n=1 Tax=Streptomyces sp. ZSW22 TaxID=3055050 RepID=UPI0025B10F9C|nr:hypothetical protein [Streptomyces sp. ZSW22]MDN3244167.1 hypothetical protein [Streptomyces sp. ZSW22]
MAFPETPLGITVDLWIDGAWTDITADVYERDSIRINRGRRGEGERTEPSRCTLTLNNGASKVAPGVVGRYSPRNPQSDLYGKIGRNTLLRVQVDGTGRFTGEVSTWPPQWTEGAHDMWVTIEAAGILRRLGQRSTALFSTLRRRIVSEPSVRAYWPMEDESAATQASSPIPGVPAMAVSGLTFGADDTLAGSTALPTVGAVASISGTVPQYAGTGEWMVVCVYNMAEAPASNATFLDIDLTGATAATRIELRLSPSAVRVYSYDVDGVPTLRQNVVPDDFYGQWNRLEISARNVGGNTELHLGWVVIGVTGKGATAILPGTCGRVGRVRSAFGPASLEGARIGHVGVFSDADSNPYGSADHGFDGESAGARFERLCQEEGIAATAFGSAFETMGPQRPATLISLLQECADTDGGIIYESRGAAELFYRSREGLYNQAPALELGYGTHVMPGLAPVEDDQATVNDVTVSRISGSSGRYVKETGPLSILDPPDGVGRYEQGVTVNLQTDTVLEDHAAWRVHLGTVDEPRYPTVPINLARNPELATAAMALDLGDRLTVSGTPVWLAADGIDVLTQGFSETLNAFEWTMQFSCTPASGWDVAKVEDPMFGRPDTDGSELAAAVDAADQTLLVEATDGPAWVTANPVLNSNPDFTADLAGWAAFGATIERVEAPQPKPFTGTWAMRLTPDGVAEFPNAGSEQIPVVVGAEYVASGWLRSATTRSVGLNVNWFGAGGAYLTTTANDQPVEAGEWTWFEVTVTAPATAETANLAPTVANFPPTTDILWAHQVTLRSAGGSPINFPFDIRYGGEIATVTAITSAAFDTFPRTVAGGWGTAESGGAWTVVGAAADYSVSPGVAAVAQPATGIAHLTLTPAPSADVDLYVDCAVSALATGASLYTGPLVRALDNDNHYQARLDFTTTNTIVLTLRKRVAGVETVLGTFTMAHTHVAGTYYRVRLQAIGTTVRARVWPATFVEPGIWHVSVTDTSLTTAGNLGTRSFRASGNTNAGVAMRFANVDLVNPQAFTVTRSVNGVVKAHTAGTDVRLAHPARLAL